jgi:hypothetical protein
MTKWQPTPMPAKCPDCGGTLIPCAEIFSHLLGWTSGKQQDNPNRHRITAVCAKCDSTWRKEWRYSDRSQSFQRGTKWDRDEYDICARMDARRRTLTRPGA